jgi:exosortase
LPSPFWKATTWCTSFRKRNNSSISRDSRMDPITGSTELEAVPVDWDRTKQARILGFALVSILPLAFLWLTMRALASTALENDTYSHIPLIPVVSLFLVYSERQRIFSRLSSGWKVGNSLLLAAAVCFALGKLNPWAGSMENELSVAMLATALAWAGAFALFFGANALRAASFPFLFLVFMIPIPEPLLSRTILFLQEQSANAAGLFFRISGIPVFREGFIFTLPGISIRVAEECSGIRSTLALLITAVLAGHLFLRTLWKKVLLCVLVFPFAILKNGLRIMVLSALAAYVNPGFLHGNLHKYGGMVFFAAGLVPLALILLLLQKTDAERTR